MKKKNLQGSLPAVCEALTGRRGIKIVWHGPPRTDGRTIWCDPLPLDTDSTGTKIVVGNIDHESGHIMFSDFERLRKETPAPLKKALWNAIEDTMVERRMRERYLGCRQTLAESAELMVARGECRTGEHGPADALTTFVDTWGRVRVNGQKVEKILQGSREALEGHIGPEGVMELEAVLESGLGTVGTTEAALALTEEILGLLKDMAARPEQGQEEKKENGQGNDRDEDEGEAGGQGEQDDASGADQGEAGQDPETAETATADGGQDAEQKEGRDAAPPPEGRQERDDGEGGTYDKDGQRRTGAESLLNDQTALEPVIDRAKAVEDVVRTAWDDWTPPNNVLETLDHEDEEAYRRAKEALRPEISKLQRQIGALFQTRTRARWIPSEERGRLDGRRLHRAVMGNRCIRREKVQTALPKPAVQILVDCSGSMAGKKMDLARAATIAVMETCERLNVPAEVIAFGTYGPIGIALVKQADRPLKRAAARIGGLQASSGTPTAEALWLGGRRLVQRREQRKLMLLVTDGEANDMEAAGDVAERLTNSGIELYGIGIGTATVQAYCPDSSVLTRSDDIAEAMLGALRKGMFER